MCTLIILIRPGHAWPLLVAGNRDERRDRTSAPPARHWEDRPEVVAGLDRLGGGSWMGCNDLGVVATVMNREGTLGPLPGKRSRGELVLEALDHGEATEAMQALLELDSNAYRPFNLFLADPQRAYWLCSRGDKNGVPVQGVELEAGLHMLTAGDLDDLAQPRIRTYFPRFRDAPSPDPEAGQWGGWQHLLGSRVYPDDLGPTAAMNLDLGPDFGTVSSSCIAVPAYPGFGARPRWLFAGGPPDQVSFEPVAF